jgi:hypothetical protein
MSDMSDIKQAAAAEIAVREGNEMIKALIAKVIDLGKAVKDASELIRQLPNQQEAMERWNQQSNQLAEDIGKLEVCMKDMTAAFDKQLEKLAWKISGVERNLGSIDMLQQALERHAGLFEKPLEKTVHYRHFLGKSAFVFLAMSLIIVLLMVLWIKAWNSSDQYAENDQKWRFVKLKTDVAIQVIVDSTERRYEADPGQFKKDVEDEEERRRELTTYMMRREELDSVGVKLKRQKKIE